MKKLIVMVASIVVLLAMPVTSQARTRGPARDGRRLCGPIQGGWYYACTPVFPPNPPPHR
jgi:hypothetical protein